MEELEIALEELNQTIMSLDNDFILEKKKNSYIFKTKDGSVAAKAQYFDYNIYEFDWILIANVDTNKKYRRLGLATKLINEIYSDLKNDHNGIYVFVKINNKNALSLYKKCNFSILKRYTLDKEIYYIMYRGDKSKLNQFENISFGG